jgi:hypothetical protein
VILPRKLAGLTAPLSPISWVLPQGVPHVLHVDHARIGADRRVHCYQSITNTIV